MSAGNASSPRIALRRVISMGVSFKPGRRENAGTGEHGVGFVVFLEALGARVPVEFSLEHHGHVVDEACRAGTMAEFGGRDGLAAAEDRIEPVAVLFLAFIQMDF